MPRMILVFPSSSLQVFVEIPDTCSVCLLLQEVSEPEIEKNASGDELDTSNIIPGGRRSRRGRAGGGGHAASYTAEQKVDSDEDSW